MSFKDKGDMSMKILNKRFTIVVGLLLLALMLTACGEQSQEDVVEKLEETVAELEGYKAEATMSMNTGEEQQLFSINSWFQKEDFYRVALSNNQDEKDNQIIVKNEDGVFVLTPALNKNFKFQTEWPENSSQPYLYQSLVEDVLTDPEAQFEQTEDVYIFKTRTNYQSNNNLPYQEIHFDKNSYTPVLVKVLDQDGNALVEVEFTNFELDPSFEEDDFTIEKNMESQESSAEVSGQGGDSSLTVLYPTYTAGAELSEEKEVDTEDGKRVMLNYAGEKNFTLVEENAETTSAGNSPQTVNGEIVNLGDTVGALTSNTIEWNADGTEYTLASDELTQEEMIQVARSVQGQAVK